MKNALCLVQLRFALAIVICVIPALLEAVTIHVPGDRPTINVGLIYSQAGDTILVACGTYAESDLTMRSGVLIRNESGDPDCVIIDPQFPGEAIMRCIGTGPGTALEGLTFTHGGGFSTFHYDGGALFVENGELIITNCAFIENESDDGGGALRCDHATIQILSSGFLRNRGHWDLEVSNYGGAIKAFGCNLTIVGCRFEENFPGDDGSGFAIYVTSTQVEISESQFLRNWGWGGDGTLSIGYSSTAIVDACLFEENHGRSAGTANVSASNAHFDGCTFVNNYGSPSILDEDELSVGGLGGSLLISNSTFVEDANQGSGLLLHASPGALAELSHCILFLGENGRIASCIGEEVILACCDAYSPYGPVWTDCYADQLGVDGNISLDPQFCGIPGSGNYYLQSDSPCAPANNNCGELIGAWPVGCGEVSTETMSWSAIKSLY